MRPPLAQALSCHLDLTLLTPSLWILSLVVAVQEQDSIVAVGMAEHTQADLLDLLDLAALLLGLVSALSHETELEDSGTELLPPRVLITDRDSLTLENLLHRNADRVPLCWRQFLDPAQARLVAVIVLEEVELIRAR